MALDWRAGAIATLLECYLPPWSLHNINLLLKIENSYEILPINDGFKSTPRSLGCPCLLSVAVKIQPGSIVGKWAVIPTWTVGAARPFAELRRCWNSKQMCEMAPSRQLLAQISQNYINQQLNTTLSGLSMPVENGDFPFFVFFSGLRRHMISAIQGRCCDIAMKQPACLRDKKRPKSPPLPLPAFPLLSTLYFCNWRCHNEINSVTITDFTSCYRPPLEEPSHEKASKNIPLSCIINIFIIWKTRVRLDLLF